MLSEEHLIRAYRATIRPLYRFVSSRTGGSTQLTEDIVQETYLRALVHWRRKGVPSQPIAWLKTTAKNLLTSHYRQAHPLAWDGMEESLASEELNLDQPGIAALVQWALLQLREEQSRLIEAFHFDGKSVKEIACEYGITERAVEGRLRRARISLRERLQPFEPLEGKDHD